MILGLWFFCAILVGSRIVGQRSFEENAKLLLGNRAEVGVV
jgi:hypothetical protein